MRNSVVCVPCRPASVSLGLLAGALLAFAPAPATAQFFGWTDPPRPSKRHYTRPYRTERADRDRGATSKREARKTEPKTPPPQMVFAVISLANQRVSIYGGDGLITTSAVSTGQAGHRTPTGIFTILEKQRWHHSNIYSGAPMPYMQRITWSGVAMHEGVVPGYPASHGCIRLPASFAPKLWEMTKVGLRVMISPTDVAPYNFSHVQLPAPKLVPESHFVQASTPRQVTDATKSEPAGTQLAAAEPVPAVPPQPRMLNPHEAAVLMKAKAQAAALASKKAAEAALVVAREASGEANAAAAALRSAKAELEAARSSSAPDDKLEELKKRFEEAKVAEDVKSTRAFELARAAREAQLAIDKAEDEVNEAIRRQSPVSVVISKKEASILIKQGKKPVYEGPVTIKDPDRPLGNHLYIATSPVEGGAGLKWVSLSAPWQVEQERSSRRSGRKSKEPEAPPAATPHPMASTAAEAFDRVEFPPEVVAKMQEIFWVGSSIVITDKGLSNENGEYTDLIVAIP